MDTTEDDQVGEQCDDFFFMNFMLLKVFKLSF